MTVNHELRQNMLIFYLVGELDHHAAHDVITYIAQQCSMNRNCSVVMDFSEVTFMDSSGLAVVLNAKRCTDRIGSRLSVCSVPPYAMKIFHAANLERIIHFE